MEINKTSAKRTMTVDEAARHLGIGRNLAYESVKRKQIPSIRLGNRILVPRQALERLLQVEETK